MDIQRKLPPGLNRTAYFQPGQLKVPLPPSIQLLLFIKVDDYLKRSSFTGSEIFMVVFSHEMEEDYVKK